MLSGWIGSVDDFDCSRLGRVESGVAGSVDVLHWYTSHHCHNGRPTSPYHSATRDCKTI